MSSIVVTRAAISSLSSPNMDKQCNAMISLNGNTLPGVYFSLTSNKYAQNFDCRLTIKAPLSSQRVIISFEKIDIACGGDSILIYDGQKDPKTLLNKDSASQCGTKVFYVRTISTNIAIIEFSSNNDGKVGTGFTINAAINFPVKPCRQADGLYQCRNEYCISKIFNCDGRNWCGDNTQKAVCR